MVIHQLRQLALAGEHVSQVETCKLVLTGVWCSNQAAFSQPVEQPVIKRALVFKLQRTQAVGNLLQCIFNRMRKGVHRIDAPLVTSVVMSSAANAVNGGVAQVDVGAGHVNFGAQHHRAIFVQAITHFLKTSQIFLHRAAAKRAIGAGVAKVPPINAHLFYRLLVHISMACLNQRFSSPVHEVKVVAGLIGFSVSRAVPVKA